MIPVTMKITAALSKIVLAHGFHQESHNQEKQNYKYNPDFKMTYSIYNI